MSKTSTHRPARKTIIQTQFDRLHHQFLSGAARCSVYHPGNRY